MYVHLDTQNAQAAIEQMDENSDSSDDVTFRGLSSAQAAIEITDEIVTTLTTSIFLTTQVLRELTHENSDTSGDDVTFRGHPHKFSSSDGADA
jgi:16S rRNA G527 N7-methylase RsmG